MLRRRYLCLHYHTIAIESKDRKSIPRPRGPGELVAWFVCLVNFQLILFNEELYQKDTIANILTSIAIAGGSMDTWR